MCAGVKGEVTVDQHVVAVGHRAFLQLDVIHPCSTIAAANANTDIYAARSARSRNDKAVLVALIRRDCLNRRLFKDGPKGDRNAHPCAEHSQCC